MPQVPFRDLPDDARVWVFGADRALSGAERAELLDMVDAHLEQWRAHGAPLTASRDFREDRFLIVGVDVRGAAASGCSIDGLHHALQEAERRLGVQLLGGGRVFYRGADGLVRSGARDEFRALAASGAVRQESPVFDTTVGTAGAARVRFEVPAKHSWHGKMFPR